MVHQFKSNDYNIVMDTASGAIHVMDPLAYDMVALIDDMTKTGTSPGSLLGPDGGEILKRAACDRGISSALDEMEEAIEELRELFAEGELFSEDSYRQDVERFLDFPTVIKAACLNVAHECNLSCEYCFAGEGHYHGQGELMSLECGKRALEFLIENSGTRKNIEVDFFGGEPLLNLDVVKSLVDYGRCLEADSGKHFRFTLTTNGVLVDDDFTDFANRELDNVVLSLDGRPGVHDRMRPQRGGGGSYERVLSGIRRFVSRRGDKKHYIRGTFTGYNTDFSADILHMADLGFKEISMEPVVAPDNEPYAITMDRVPEILAEYDALALEMARRQGTESEFNFFHFAIDLEGGPCVYKRLTGCGAGTEYVAITPGGDIYPCHQFVGDSAFCIGNVYTGIDRPELVRRFKGVNVYTKDSCRECFAAMYCSGGCMANAHNAHGDIGAVYEIGCELQKKRIECAIMLEVNKILKETTKEN